MATENLTNTKNVPVPHIAVLGGDVRLRITAGELAKEGFAVYRFAANDPAGTLASKDVVQTNDLKALADLCDVFLFPLPTTRDDVYLHAPLFEEKITLDSIFSAISKSGHDVLLLGGKLSAATRKRAADFGLELIDYYCREELQIANAIPTTEGAIALAMQHFPYTLHHSRCTVLGYGRIGKILSHTLHALGANVCVVARKESDFAWIDADGCTPVALGNWEQALTNCQLLFNTVPSMLITEEQMRLLPHDAILIDLASERGIDAQSAQRHGNQVFWALSLPGKVAPATAGCIIKDNVMHILQTAYPPHHTTNSSEITHKN